MFVFFFFCLCLLYTENEKFLHCLVERGMEYVGPRHKRSVSQSVKVWIAERQQWLCNWCKHPLENTYQVDHVRPLWHGGSNLPANLQALCPNCHARKTKHESGIMPVQKKNSRNQVFIFCPLCKGKFSPYFNHFCGLLKKIEPIEARPLLSNVCNTASTP